MNYDDIIRAARESGYAEALGMALADLLEEPPAFPSPAAPLSLDNFHDMLALIVDQPVQPPWTQMIVHPRDAEHLGLVEGGPFPGTGRTVTLSRPVPIVGGKPSPRVPYVDSRTATLRPRQAPMPSVALALLGAE